MKREKVHLRMNIKASIRFLRASRKQFKMLRHWRRVWRIVGELLRTCQRNMKSGFSRKAELFQNMRRRSMFMVMRGDQLKGRCSQNWRRFDEGSVPSYHIFTWRRADPYIRELHRLGVAIAVIELKLLNGEGDRMGLAHCVMRVGYVGIPFQYRISVRPLTNNSDYAKLTRKMSKNNLAPGSMTRKPPTSHDMISE